MRHPTALILSANRLQCDAWTRMLRQAGFNVRASGSANASLEGPCVVVLDADHPVASPELVLLHANAAGAPAIVIARDFDATEWLSLFRDGAFDVLRRPVSADELCASVAAASRRFGSLRERQSHMLGRGSGGGPQAGSWIERIRSWISSSQQP